MYLFIVFDDEKFTKLCVEKVKEFRSSIDSRKWFDGGDYFTFTIEACHINEDGIEVYDIYKNVLSVEVN